MKTAREILEELLCIATDDMGYVYSEDGTRDITQALTNLDALVPEKETYCRFDGGNYEHMHGRNEVIDEMHKIYKDKK